jgi:hypothetical protein
MKENMEDDRMTSSGSGSTSYERDRGRMLTGMFSDRNSAEGAYNALSQRGYTHNDVNVIMSDETRKKHFSDDRHTELGNKAMEGAGAGSAIGGTIGAVAGIIAALGTSLVIPGLGVVIAGPIAAGLAGAGAGGIGGGIIGALIGSGIPEDRAKMYESGVKQGNIVLGVTPRNDEDADYLEREWKNNRGENVYR